jgi:hypothetical protein
MRRRLAAPLIAALAVLVLAIHPASAYAASPTSPNWAGYVAQSGKPFTRVTGRWTEPTAQCGTSGSSVSAFWVGLDGYQDQTVEQIGVQAKCTDGVASYYAWWQMWPSPYQDLPVAEYPVRPADVMTASVSRSGDNYTLTLQSSAGWKFSTVQTATAEDSSAEWIASSPRRCESCKYDLLANFQQIGFTDAEAATTGPLRPVSTFTHGQGPVSLTMVDAAGTVRAQPGALDQWGGGFTVVWKHS